MRKKRYWECVFAGTMHKQIWRGAVHDDDDSYYSGSAEKAGDNLDGELTESDNEDNEANDSKKIKKRSSASLKTEMADLVDRYELEDTYRTPQPDETLADFYARTSEYWNDKAATRKTTVDDKSNDVKPSHSAKDRKREGFGLARVRFEELEPVIERLMALKLQRKEKKDEKSEKREGKSKSKKSSSKG